MVIKKVNKFANIIIIYGNLNLEKKTTEKLIILIYSK
jgi:hypothetical protein